MLCNNLGHFGIWETAIVIALTCGFVLYKIRTSRYRAIETLALQGLPIPPSLLGNRNRGPIYAGISLICIAIATALFFWVIGGRNIEGNDIPSWLPILAIFPFMAGVAQFLIVAVNKRLAE